MDLVDEDEEMQSVAKRGILCGIGTAMVLSCMFVTALFVRDVTNDAGRESAIDVPDPVKTVPYSVADLRLPFLANRGQCAEEVQFYSRIFAGTVFVSYAGEIVYSMPNDGNPDDPNTFSFKETFVNRPVTPILGDKKSETRVNVFKGSDRSRWVSAIPAYDELDWGEIYPGIRLTLRSHINNVEKVFSVAPGVDLSRIRVRVADVDGLRVNELGELELISTEGTISFTPPVAYQEYNGQQEYVDVAYTINGEDEYGFAIGSYDPSRPLIIDPLLASTLLGGGGREGSALFYGLSLGRGPDGSVYVAGATNSADFPQMPGMYDDDYNGGEDVFVAKFNSALTTLEALTYLGGSADEEFPNVVVGEGGLVYVAGTTLSADFPCTPGAYDNIRSNPADAFVSVLNDDLSELLASTYVGGSGSESRVELALDGYGKIFLTGATTSGTGFPTTASAFDPSYNGGTSDFFICALDLDLTTLIASTFLGGSSEELNPIVHIDNLGNVYITGATASLNIPTTAGAYDNDFNGPPLDGFIAKLSNNLDTLRAATFIGGSDFDGLAAMGLDDTGNIYARSHTMSPDFPVTPGLYDQVHSGWYEYAVCKLDGDLANLLASTFITPNDSGKRHCWGTFVTGDGTVYLGGIIEFDDLPTTPCAFDDSFNGGTYDAFLSVLSSDFTRMEYSTYYGGSGDESIGDIFVSDAGNVYTVGFTSSPELPTTDGAYDRTYNGGASDAVVAKFQIDLDCDDDGIENHEDNCPLSPNSTQEDFDTDGIGDVCDNCLNIYNPAQEDLDSDGIGDSCEISRTWWVFADGSGATPTIQAAIDSSYHGDTISLADGLYSGDGNRDLDFRGRRGLIIKSENGPASTIIECGGTPSDPHRWLTVQDGIDSTCIIDGVTIRGGYGPQFEGSPSGGALLITGSSPTIQNSVFVDNGAMIGGAVYAKTASPRFINCTFAGNAAYYGAALCGLNNSGFQLKNSLLAFNEQNPPVYCFEAGPVVVECTNVYGNAGGDWVECLAGQSGINGNISADPLFCNMDIGDVGLSGETSPCLPTNNDCAELIGALGLECMYPCDCGVWGDVDGSLTSNPVDVVYMVNFVYKNQDARVQPVNCPYEAGDADCNNTVNPVDVVYFVNLVYKNQNAFCVPCP